MVDKEKVKLVIDTDAGVDDALAILLAISSPNVEIVAITCTYGNISVDKVWHNVLRVLQHFDKSDIPVYVGCDRPLVRDLFTDAAFHGEDGLGNVNFPRDEKLVPRTEKASVALVDYANKFPGELTVVGLGPMTNLAIAQRLDHKFSSKLKNLVYMGGNVTAFGNITPSAEFNFYCDPEAVHVVLNDFTCPIHCVPWEPCYEQRLSKDTYLELTSGDTKASKFAKEITTYSVNWINSDKSKSDGYFVCDLFTMVYVLNPSVATQMEKWPVYVELRGKHTRGEMIVDRRSTTARKNVFVVMEFDMEKVLDALRKLLL